MQKKRRFVIALLVLVMSLGLTFPAGAAGHAGFNVDCTGAFGFGDVPTGDTYTWTVRLSDGPPNYTVLQTASGAIAGPAAFDPVVLWTATPPAGSLWRITIDDASGQRVFFGEGEFNCPPPPGGEGCTPGYWKNHTGLKSQGNAWALTLYTIDDLYHAEFGVPYFETLLGALKTGGGGEKALGRHAVAALLNARHPGVSYFYSPAEVIQIVQGAYASGDFEGAKNLLEAQNGDTTLCPLN